MNNEILEKAAEFIETIGGFQYEAMCVLGLLSLRAEVGLTIDDAVVDFDDITFKDCIEVLKADYGFNIERKLMPGEYCGIKYMAPTFFLVD